MNALLTADLHLTDNELEEYRWKIFDVLESAVLRNQVEVIFILGDAFDRKDRHSAKLVNYFVEKLLYLQDKTHCWIIIDAGNHDAPLKGVYYWNFLNQYDMISYVTSPVREAFHYGAGLTHIWILPFSPNPKEEWKDLDLASSHAIMMHQPVQGVLLDGQRTLDKAPELPPMPDVPLFSGDIHHQQVFNGITYIGTPHPVHFDEVWRNRILLVKNSDFRHPFEIHVDGTRRAIIELTNADQIYKSQFKKGDQLRIRYKLSGDSLATWPAEQEKIRNWAIEQGVHLASVEASIVGEGLKANVESPAELEIMQPDEVIQKFCKDEHLGNDVLDVGLEIIKECQ